MYGMGDLQVPRSTYLSLHYLVHNDCFHPYQDRNWKKSHQVMGVLSEMVPEAMTEAVMTHIKGVTKFPVYFLTSLLTILPLPYL